MGNTGFLVEREEKNGRIIDLLISFHLLLIINFTERHLYIYELLLGKI